MKNKLVLLFLIIIAALLGGIIGNLADGVSGLDWLAYSKTIGFTLNELNLSFLDFAISLHIYPNVAQIILIIIALPIAPKVAAAIKTS